MSHEIMGKSFSMMPLEPIDDDLERAIGRAGRDKVFASARALGWTNEIPPKWVWRMIVAELETQGTC